MNKIKTMLFTMLGVIIAVAVIGILISAAKKDIDNQTHSQTDTSAVSDDSSDNTDSEEDTEIEQIFLFMEMRYVGDTIEGSLVDRSGRRFKVKVDNPDGDLSEQEFYEKALEQYYDADEEQWLPQEDMKMLYKTILKTDDNFGFSISEESFDTTYYLYCIQDFGTPFFIEIYSEGSTSDLPTNKYSMELFNYFMDINGTPERKLDINTTDESTADSGNSETSSDNSQTAESSVFEPNLPEDVL